MTDLDFENDAIPTAGEHRGVGLHAGQSETRLQVVRGDIDKVIATGDVTILAQMAANVALAPEARLLAAAKCQAAFSMAVSDRRVRPDVRLQAVQASIAGLNHQRWQDPARYCSLLDAWPGDEGEMPAVRGTPLED